MKLTKALRKLSRDKVMGVKGTDWSWYYRLGIGPHGELDVINEDGKTRSFNYADLLSDDWIVISRKKLKKKRGR